MDDVFLTQLDRGDSFPVRLTYEEITYLVPLLANRESPYATQVLAKIRPFLKAGPEDSDN